MDLSVALREVQLLRVSAAKKQLLYQSQRVFKNIVYGTPGSTVKHRENRDTWRKKGKNRVTKVQDGV